MATATVGEFLGGQGQVDASFGVPSEPVIADERSGKVMNVMLALIAPVSVVAVEVVATTVAPQAAYASQGKCPNGLPGVVTLSSKVPKSDAPGYGQLHFLLTQDAEAQMRAGGIIPDVVEAHLVSGTLLSPGSSYWTRYDCSGGPNESRGRGSVPAPSPKTTGVPAVSPTSVATDVPVPKASCLTNNEQVGGVDLSMCDSTVARLQKALAALGAPLNIDGSYGPVTLGAVRSAEQLGKLPKTTNGYVALADIVRLEAYLVAGSPVPGAAAPAPATTAPQECPGNLDSPQCVAREVGSAAGNVGSTFGGVTGALGRLSTAFGCWASRFVEPITHAQCSNR